MKIELLRRIINLNRAKYGNLTSFKNIEEYLEAKEKNNFKNISFIVSTTNHRVAGEENSFKLTCIRYNYRHQAK